MKLVILEFNLLVIDWGKVLQVGGGSSYVVSYLSIYISYIYSDIAQAAPQGGHI